MKNNSKLVWDRHLGEVLYPDQQRHPRAGQAGAAVRARVRRASSPTRIAENFYKHDPNSAVRNGCDGESVADVPTIPRPQLLKRRRVAAGFPWRAGGRLGGGGCGGLGHPLSLRRLGRPRS